MKKLKLNGEYSIEELNALIEESKKPKFVNEGRFFILLDDLGEWLANATDIKLKNHYQTQEEAERHAKYFQLFTDLYFFAKEHNEGWVPDFDDENQLKYGIEFFGVFTIASYQGFNAFLFGISFKSKEIAEKALKKFVDRLTDYLEIQK